jgi:hypothetical protein
LTDLYTRLYPGGSYAAVGEDPWRINRRVREFCQRYGLRDRIPRPIVPGDRRYLNKRIAEHLADKTYTLELERASASSVWAHRKAAWAVDDLEQEVGALYRSLGRRGLEAVPDIGPAIAGEIEAILGQSAS